MPLVSIYVLASMITVGLGVRYPRLKVRIVHIKMITSNGKLSFSKQAEYPFLTLPGTLANSFSFLFCLFAVFFL